MITSHSLLSSRGKQCCSCSVCLAAQAQTVAGRRSAELANVAPAPSDGAQSTKPDAPAPPPATATPPAGTPTTSIPDAPAPTPGTDAKPGTQPASDQQSVPPPNRSRTRRPSKSSRKSINESWAWCLTSTPPTFKMQPRCRASRNSAWPSKAPSILAPFWWHAVDAAYNQATDAFPAYGQGVKGYAKYLGASYADTFDGTMLGNALFPCAPEAGSALLSQRNRDFHLSPSIRGEHHLLVQERQRKQGSELLQSVGESGRRGDFQPLLSRGGSGRILDHRARVGRHRGRCASEGFSRNSGRTSRARCSRIA